MTELLARLTERMVHRQNYVWESERAWLDNAQEEHVRAPFRAIIATSNPTAHSGTMIADEVNDSMALWAAPRGVPIARSAHEMAATVAAMLRIAKEVRQRLHNRYILTDVGGLVFGAGLDEGAAGESDDVTLMDRAQYVLRWSEHATETMAFDIPELQVEIRSRG